MLPRPLIFVSIFTLCFCDDETLETVAIKPHTTFKYFNLPTSSEPVVSWIDIQRGTYPNTTAIGSVLKVGEPITVFIYLKDKSNLYDIKVTDCWAYDEENVEDSKNKLHLTGDKIIKSKMIGKWSKRNLPPGQELKSYLYAGLKSFKFPDKDQIYMTCDIQLCFKVCDI